MKITPDIHPERLAGSAGSKERGWFFGVRFSATWEEAMGALRGALGKLKSIIHGKDSNPS